MPWIWVFSCLIVRDEANPPPGQTSDWRATLCRLSATADVNRNQVESGFRNTFSKPYKTSALRTGGTPKGLYPSCVNSAVQPLCSTYEGVYRCDEGVSMESASEGRRVVTPASTGIKGKVGVVLGTFAVCVTDTDQIGTVRSCCSSLWIDGVGSLLLLCFLFVSG